VDAACWWLKPVSDRRLSDLVSVGVLTRTFPTRVVDEVIAGCERTERRHRSLPARTMAQTGVSRLPDTITNRCADLAWRQAIRVASICAARSVVRGRGVMMSIMTSLPDVCHS